MVVNGEILSGIYITAVELSGGFQKARKPAGWGDMVSAKREPIMEVYVNCTQFLITSKSPTKELGRPDPWVPGPVI